MLYRSDATSDDRKYYRTLENTVCKIETCLLFIVSFMNKMTARAVSSRWSLMSIFTFWFSLAGLS